MESSDSDQMCARRVVESSDSEGGRVRFGEVAKPHFSDHDCPKFHQIEYAGVRSGVEDGFCRGRSRAIKSCTMSKVEIIKSQSRQSHNIPRRTIQEAFDEAVTTNTDKTSTRTQTHLRHEPRTHTPRTHTRPHYDAHTDDDAGKSFGPRPDVNICVS